MTTVETLDLQIVQVRDAIASCRADGPVVRYPDDLRRVGGQLVDELRNRGWTNRRISVELGAPSTTLDRWLRRLYDGADAVSQASFLPVRIEPDDVAVVCAAAARLTLHAPGGWRVEGLTVSDVATLLRAGQS